jgi:RHS repeat-associated protein
VQFGNPITNDNVQAGYGYVSNSLQETDLYYFHPDHLGSTSIITDRQGVATQFVAYLPSGASFVEEHSSTWESLYLFSGKELDASTSLYYFGARYYDPEASIWYGIDPLTERHPNIGGMVYCFDSPTKVIDPTGEDGIVVVDEETKSITIKANIILYSKEAGVGRASLDKAAKEYKKNIMDNWSKDANGNAWTTEHNGETYTVNFDVDVSVNTQAAYEKNRDYNGMNNYIEVKGNSRFRSEVSGDMQNGRWAIPTPESNHAAHEFGHLIGLMDRYTDVYNDNGRVTGSIPHSGWKGNIMADNGRVEQRNINNIFNRRNSPSTSLLSENRPKYLLPFGVYIFKINNRNRSERYKM